MRQVLILSVVCSGAIGCQSGPRWDWWRLGSARAPDSSPIARSAGPSLPSELAQQDESSQLAGNTQMPVVDSGGEAPPYEQDNPRLSTAMSGLAGTGYSSPHSGYGGTRSMSPSESPATSSPANVAGDPFARPRGRDMTTMPGVSVQNGPYGTGGLAANPPASTSTSPTGGSLMPSDGNRYGYNGSQYGGSNLAGSATQHETAAPWSTTPSMPSEGIAAAGYQQPSTSGINGNSPGDYAATPSYPTTPSSPHQIAVSPQGYSGSIGGSGGYGGNSGGRYGAAATEAAPFGAGSQQHLAERTGNAAPSYSPPTIQTAGNSTPQPYRPGGTSDYTGPGGSSPISLAGRQTDATTPSGTTSQSTLPTGMDSRYSDPPSEYGGSGTGIGRRY